MHISLPGDFTMFKQKYEKMRMGLCYILLDVKFWLYRGASVGFFFVFQWGKLVFMTLDIVYNFILQWGNSHKSTLNGFRLEYLFLLFSPPQKHGKTNSFLPFLSTFHLQFKSKQNAHCDSQILFVIFIIYKRKHYVKHYFS